MLLGIDYISLWNYIGGMNIIFPKDIPSDFMMMERESARSPKSPIDVHLAGDLMTVEAVA